MFNINCNWKENRKLSFYFLIQDINQNKDDEIRVKSVSACKYLNLIIHFFFSSKCKWVNEQLKRRIHFCVVYEVHVLYELEICTRSVDM